MNLKIFVTGSAGFIGSFITLRLLEEGFDVVGMDNLNDYYDTRLKFARLAMCGIDRFNAEKGTLVTSSKYSTYRFIKADLEDRIIIEEIFLKGKFDMVCNMAAQAGVRFSMINPYCYVESNIVGVLNLLECCRRYKIKHFVYASSSSVYGMNTKVPFSENDRVDCPVSVYAATKRANELMAHTYSKLYDLPTTGLRFFTVYGPYGRPDMAPMIFAKAILEGKPVDVFNNGNLSRDFTYIDDVVEGTVKVIMQPSVEEIPYKIYNIACSSPVNLLDFISTMEHTIGKAAKKIYKPMQAGDLQTTYADISLLKKEIGYLPKVKIEEGIANFVKWYCSDDNPIRSSGT